MTKKQAIKYSLVKWEYYKNTGCNKQEGINWLHINHPKICDFRGFCGLCEKYYDDIYGCIDCLLCEKWDISCACDKSLYAKWIRAKIKKTRIKYATKIYNDIESLLEE